MEGVVRSCPSTGICGSRWIGITKSGAGTSSDTCPMSCSRLRSSAETFEQWLCGRRRGAPAALTVCFQRGACAPRIYGQFTCPRPAVARVGHSTTRAFGAVAELNFFHVQSSGPTCQRSSPSKDITQLACRHAAARSHLGGFISRSPGPKKSFQCLPDVVSCRSDGGFGTGD